jgi:hypothetical protein
MRLCGFPLRAWAPEGIEAKGRNYLNNYSKYTEMQMEPGRREAGGSCGGCRRDAPDGPQSAADLKL